MKGVFFLAITILSISLNIGWADSLDDLITPPPIMCSENEKSDDFLYSSSYQFTPKIYSNSFYISASQISGNQIDQIHYANGNVIAYKNKQYILADWLYLQTKEYHHLQAGDHFNFNRQSDIISGQYFDYYFDLHRGMVQNGQIKSKNKNLIIKAKKIIIKDNKHFNVWQGMFTSCNITNPDWYITADSINFDYQKSQADGKYGSLYFKSLPLIKSKNIFFPLGARKSGWLRPNIGSTHNNAYTAIPYYWNQASNYDNTITPKLWSQSGLMIADEQRYLINYGYGNSYTEQVPYDFSTQNYRWLYDINGIQVNNYDNNVSFQYKYKQVSDQEYFLNFGTFDAVTKNVNLEQSVSLSAKENWGDSDILLQNYQIVIPKGYNAVAPIYSRLPQISFNSSKLNWNNFNLGINSNYNYFYNQDHNNSQPSGQRLFLYPNLSYLLQNQWSFIKPEIDGFLDYYQISANDYSQQPESYHQIQAPVFSIDSGLKFDKIYNQQHISQTFEPRLLYVYIPQIDQNNIPVFDTATATYNYNQLYNPISFAGYDRVNQANNITYGFTSKFINNNNNKQFANIALGYQQFFFNNNNYIYGDPHNVSQLYLPRPNFIIENSYTPNNQHYLSANLQINTTYSNHTTSPNIDNFSIKYQFLPEDYKLLNTKLSYQYHLPLLYYDQLPGQLGNGVYENQYALDVSGQWPIYKNKLLIATRNFYDFTAKRNMNFLGGITYNGGCWNTSLIGQEYVINLTHHTGAVMLELSLNQVGTLATSTALSKSLVNNIEGYKPLPN